jgi:hypothetical protein
MICEPWTFRIQTLGASHIVPMFDVMGRNCRSQFLNFWCEVRLQGQGKSTKILWPGFEPIIIRMRGIARAAVLCPCMPCLWHISVAPSVFMPVTLWAPTNVLFVSLHFFLRSIRKFRQTEDTLLTHGHPTVWLVISELSRSICAVFFFIMAYVLIHGPSNIAQTLQPLSSCIQILLQSSSSRYILMPNSWYHL